MSKHIFEEQGGPHRGHAAGKTDAEKQASQLASDVKYKVKQRMSGATKLNPAQVSKAYLAQLAKSPAPPAVKALAKKKIVGEEYTEDIKELVEKSLVNALVHVFTEEVGEKKEWIVVTDKKTGNTYRRQATRAKIAELRSNPNISRVEITAYHPDKDDDKQGKKTAKVKAGKGLDPVGREDKDIDNDGDHDKSDKYLLNRRKVRGAAIAKKKVAEEFLGEVKEKTETENKKITGEKVNNYSGKDSVVKVFPSLGEQLDDKEVVAKPQQKKPVIDPNEKRQISNLQQFQNKERQLNQQKLAAQKSGRIPVGSVQTSSFEPEGEVVNEGDYWHPDPEQDKKLSDRGAKLRSREDAEEKSKPKEDPKKLRPGESYTDWNKRQQGGSSVTKPAAKPSIKDKLKNKLGKAIDKLGGINSSFEPDGEDIQEVAPPSAKAERMVKHIKKAYSKDGELTKKEKSIAYATAWKQHNKEVKEEKTDTKDESEDLRSIPTKMDLLKNKMRAKGIKVAGITPAPRNMKTADELGEAVDRAEYGKVAAEPTPKDDKKAAYAFKDNKNRQRDLKKLARLVRHADGQKRNPALYNSFEAEGEVIDERTRERKGQPRPARNRATEMIRKMPEVKKGLMTRSGKTVAKHEAERGVKKEPGAPTPKGETTADRLEAKKRKAAIAKASAQRSQDNMSSRFD
jgi:hypothetical protein